MCGLAGILRVDGGSIPADWLAALDREIAPRGPDGAGRFTERVDSTAALGGGEVALVHRRLAIIDPIAGVQPMTTRRPDGRGGVTTVFNGCIYNHRALRASLQRAGHRFRTDHADTETLVHGWREHGIALPQQLEGMYAFAIWDSSAATLCLARDPFGEKPLWIWRPRPEIIAFASTAAALGALGASFGGDRAAVTPAAVADYLRRGHGWNRDAEMTAAPTPLPPGTWMTVRCADAGTVEIKRGRHHELAAAAGVAPTVDDVERAVETAVAQRLEADVPLGCFLSGGVDSALVAAMARRHRRSLKTYCVRMPDPRLDESARAAAIATHLGTDHRTLDAQAGSAAEDLVRLAAAVGVPFGDSSILPTHWVSRAARREVAVALSGDGGDELFLGYRRHVAADRIASLRRVLRHLPTWLPSATLVRVGDVARDLPHTGVVAFAAPFPERMVGSLVPDAPPPRALPIDDGRHGALRALRRFDLTTYLPDDLMLKVDAASMAVALEVRSPLLDRTLSSLALRAPIDALLDAPPCRGRKALLRAAARRHLPAQLVDGPKRGFAIPIGRWWRNDFGGLATLLEDTLAAADPFRSLPVDVGTARRLVREHRSGRAEHGQRLFLLLSLALWAQR